MKFSPDKQNSEKESLLDIDYNQLSELGNLQKIEIFCYFQQRKNKLQISQKPGVCSK